ncbi:hypothetical protein HTZ84_04900 [Haloterrigena sp. SYSU A558-1]|uniref:Uncharacterized protein n=1 Tax=Haloterrigena gelatinilytica TaxID=2741724 RepID=A0ABX2LEX4_9EURY|nr:hypothetical protein [Haloterrigena gelatinilytica]NUC71654.1 hypothetical protein [Haloterrigena gelatinilytica]
MSGDEAFPSAKVADAIRNDEVDALIDAVMTDSKETGDLLLMLERANGGEPPEDSPLYNMLSRQGNTDTLRKARKSGDVATMSAATGWTESRIEATGYEMLIKAMKPAAQQVLIKGPKGSGKTGMTTDALRQLHRDGHIDKVMMNFPVKGMPREELEKVNGYDAGHPWLDPDTNPSLGDLDFVRFSEHISDYLEFAKEPGKKVGVFDEFSTVGNAYNNQQDVEKVMGLSINAFRKSPDEGGEFKTIYIGHENDNDIHPLVKKQSDVIIRKEGKKDEGKIDKAEVYRGWDAFKSGEKWFGVRGLLDVPEDSPWRYDTNYFAHMEWNLDEPDMQIDRGMLIDDWEKYQDDDEDGSDSELELLKCRGVAKDGDGCGQVTRHISGFCDMHRDQWQGDDDPRRKDSD